MSERQVRQEKSTVFVKAVTPTSVCKQHLMRDPPPALGAVEGNECCRERKEAG